MSSVPLALSLYTARELESTVGAICLTLKDATSAPWADRLAALRKLQALVEGGAYHFDNFPVLLKQLRGPLEQQVLDLRSAVVKEATATLTLLGARLGDAYEAEVDHFVPALFKLLGVSIAIIKESANDCLRALLCSAPKASKPLTRIFEGCSAISAPLRLRCMEYVLLLLEVRNRHVATRFESTVQAVLKARLADKNEEVRHKARQACCAYLAMGATGGTNSPGSAETWVTSELDEKTRRLIRQEQVAYESAKQTMEDQAQEAEREQDQQRWMNDQPEHHISPPTSPSHNYQSTTAAQRRKRAMQEEKEVVRETPTSASASSGARNRSDSAVRRARSSLSTLNAAHKRAASIPPARPASASAATLLEGQPTRKLMTPAKELGVQQGESRRVSAAYRTARDEVPLPSGMPPAQAFHFDQATRSPRSGAMGQAASPRAATVNMNASATAARGRARVSLGGTGTVAGLAQSARRASSTHRAGGSMTHAAATTAAIAQQAWTPYGAATARDQPDQEVRTISNSPAPAMPVSAPAASSVRRPGSANRAASASRGRQAPALTSTHAVRTHLPLSPTVVAPRNAPHVHKSLVDPALNPSQRAQLIAQLLEQAKESVWSKRVGAFEGLAALFATRPADPLGGLPSSPSSSSSGILSAAGGRRIPELWIAQHQIIFGLKAGLGDVHHKVSSAVLTCLTSVLTPSGPAGGQYSLDECKPVLDRLLADIFACLSHGRLSIREQANSLLNHLTASFSVDLLLSTLLAKSFDAIHATPPGTNHAKVRLGILEFVHYLMPMSGDFFRQTSHGGGDGPVGVNLPMKHLLARIGPFLSLSASASQASGDPKLKKLALAVCHTLYLGYAPQFFAALACLPVPLNRLVRRALVESLPDIEKRIAEEGERGRDTQDDDEDDQQPPQDHEEDTRTTMRELDFDRSQSHQSHLRLPDQYQQQRREEELESSPWDSATVYSTQSAALPTHSPASTYSMPFQQQPAQPPIDVGTSSSAFNFARPLHATSTPAPSSYSPQSYADAPYSMGGAVPRENGTAAYLPSVPMTRSYSAPTIDALVSGHSAQSTSNRLDAFDQVRSASPWMNHTPQSDMDAYDQGAYSTLGHSAAPPMTEASLLTLLSSAGSANLHRASRRASLQSLQQVAGSPRAIFAGGACGWERMLLLLADGLAEACQANPRDAPGQLDLAQVVLATLAALVQVHTYAFQRMVGQQQHASTAASDSGRACMELLLRSLLHALRSELLAADDGPSGCTEVATACFTGMAALTPIETLLPLLLQQISSPPSQRTTQDEAALKLVLQTLTHTVDTRMTRLALLGAMSDGTGDAWLDVLVRGLAGCTAEQVLVRKLVIGAFVSLYAQVDDELQARLASLPPVLAKLVRIYTQKYDEKHRRT